MHSRKLEQIERILTAAKRAAIARLRARMLEIARLRADAADLRTTSASLPPCETLVEMTAQSQYQYAAEQRARDLEAQALELEADADELRATLANAMGREQAATMLKQTAKRTEQVLAERRAEDVPRPGRSYASLSPGPSSVGTE